MNVARPLRALTLGIALLAVGTAGSAMLASQEKLPPESGKVWLIFIADGDLSAALSTGSIVH
jgi:hypothetical protein